MRRPKNIINSGVSEVLKESFRKCFPVLKDFERFWTRKINYVSMVYSCYRPLAEIEVKLIAWEQY